MVLDGRELRLQRLVGDGRAVIIAVDHGLFDGPIPAMEDLPKTVGKINPQVDAVLQSPGMLRHCHAIFARPKRPLAVVRLNWNTVYCFGLGYREAPSVYTLDAESALREGMDIALVSLTLETGVAHYWSRSRNALWRKGDTSGQTQRVIEMRVDCDQDAILLRVEAGGDGGACHTGRKSCFYRSVDPATGALSFIKR